MAAVYRIDVLNTSGVKRAEIVEYRHLAYTKRRNAPGECTFTLNGDNEKIDFLTENALIEIWRKNETLGLDWYCDFYGIIRGEERVTNKVNSVTIHCPGILDKLNDRIVAYPPESTNRSYFTSINAERILNTLAKYNLTSSGTTADGRVRLATMSGVTVEADGNSGPTVDLWDCAEEVLLETMYALATQYKVAFDLVNSGPNTWEWQYITNTDVSDTQIFAIDRGNVSEIRYKKDRTNERTIAIIGGKGEGLLKEYQTREGTNYDVSTNNREVYVNSGSDSIAEQWLDGDRELVAREAKDQIEFDILSTASSYYGLHYNLNYLVTGQYNGTDYPLVVSEVSIEIPEGANREIVKARLEDV
jgi:hypothetical protein